MTSMSLESIICPSHSLSEDRSFSIFVPERVASPGLMSYQVYSEPGSNALQAKYPFTAGIPHPKCCFYGGGRIRAKRCARNVGAALLSQLAKAQSGVRKVCVRIASGEFFCVAHLHQQ